MDERMQKYVRRTENPGRVADEMDGRYLVARWSDETGENTIAGVVKQCAPLVVLSVGGYGLVQVPSGAELSVPVGKGQAPRRVGKA